MAGQLKIADGTAGATGAAAPAAIGQRVQFANSLRGLACLSVVFAHYAGVFWEAPDAVASLTGMPTYTVSGDAMPLANRLDNALHPIQWGPLGVAVFFLISGFVIPFSIQRTTVAQFLVGRMLRIWPTYLCGFAFTIAMIALGSWSYGSPLLFGRNDLIIHSLPGIRDLLNGKNIDGIIWTLEIEVKFYLLCALTAAWFRRSSQRVFIVPLCLAGTALSVSAYLPVLSPSWAPLATVFINASQYLVFMYIGVALHYLHTGKISGQQACAWAATLCMSCGLIWTQGPYASSLPIAWNYAAALCLFAWAMSTPRVFGENRVLDWMAAISYPLYVVHGVTGYVIMRWLYAAGVPASAVIVLTFLATCSVAYLLHILVELPSQRLSKMRLSRVEQREATVDAKHAA